MPTHDHPLTRRRLIQGGLAAAATPLLVRAQAAQASVLPRVPRLGAAAAPAGMPTDKEILKTISELTANGARRTGSAALDTAVAYVRDHFASYGLSGVHVEQAPTYSWEVVEHSLSLAGRPVDAFPVAWSQTPHATFVGDSATPAGGLRTQVVDIGLGTPAEIEAANVAGKIALFDLKFLLPLTALAPITEFLWDPGATLEQDPNALVALSPYETDYGTVISSVASAGAVGFIGVLADYFNSNRYYNENYADPSLPGMWVTKQQGARIRSVLKATPQAPATMVLHTHHEQVMGHAVVGYLDGQSDDTILVTSHHDSVWTGSVEDGSGTAEVLALAKYYAQTPYRKREKSLMFVTFDTHFSGYQMHAAFVTRHVDKRTDRHKPVAVVTLEHICKHAKVAADGSLQMTDLPELRGIFETLGPTLKAALIKAIVANDLRRTAVLDAEPLQPLGIPTDSSWAVLSGLPTASLISGPVYLYDADDTQNKVLVDELQKVAVTFAQLIDAIDVTPTSEIGLPAPYPQQSTAPPSTGG